MSVNIISNCPICRRQDTSIDFTDHKERMDVRCKRCGSFKITKTALREIDIEKYPDWSIRFSYWIRNHQDSTSRKELDRNLVNKLIELIELPKPKEQADILINWIGKMAKFPEEIIEFNYHDTLPIIGASTYLGVKYIVDHLINEGFLTGTINDLDSFSGMITFNGWERYDSLQHTSSESRLAFMAMDFKNNKLEEIFHTHIKPAVEETGFHIRDLRENQPMGQIDNQLAVEIRKSRFIIADLTDDNHGAYWESGFATGLGISVLYICEQEKFKLKKTHFDTSHHVTITWKDDPVSLEKFKKELKATIRATLPADAVLSDSKED
ncbi:MAG: hypothetical protein KKA84_16305 [Bacteroidetes bacterium]|nr:hypothetical protein [Bacteroidota bacterium]